MKNSSAKNVPILLTDSNLPGIVCPICSSTSWDTCETRPTTNAVRRRRQCVDCGSRITTLEMDIEKIRSMSGKGRRLSSLKKDLLSVSNYVTSLALKVEQMLREEDNV